MEMWNFNLMLAKWIYLASILKLKLNHSKSPLMFFCEIITTCKIRVLDRSRYNLVWTLFESLI